MLFLFLVVRMLTGGVPSRPSNELLASLAVAAFLFFVFYFTNHYMAALNMTTLNRALMYLVPTLIFYIFVHCPLPAMPARPGAT